VRCLIDLQGPFCHDEIGLAAAGDTETASK
jgi:hypothetical protein